MKTLECSCPREAVTEDILRFVPTCVVHGEGRHCCDCGELLKPHEQRRCTHCNVVKHFG